MRRSTQPWLPKNFRDIDDCVEKSSKWWLGLMATPDEGQYKPINSQSSAAVYAELQQLCASELPDLVRRVFQAYKLHGDGLLYHKTCQEVDLVLQKTYFMKRMNVTSGWAKTKQTKAMLQSYQKNQAPWVQAGHLVNAGFRTALPAGATGKKGSIGTVEDEEDQ